MTDEHLRQSAQKIAVTAGTVKGAADEIKSATGAMEASTDRIEDSADRRTVLAADRTALAAERTYAAWVRTGLAALASGIGAKALLTGVVPNLLVLMADPRSSYSARSASPPPSGDKCNPERSRPGRTRRAFPRCCL